MEEELELIKFIEAQRNKYDELRYDRCELDDSSELYNIAKVVLYTTLYFISIHLS